MSLLSRLSRPLLFRAHVTTVTLVGVAILVISATGSPLDELPGDYPLAFFIFALLLLLTELRPMLYHTEGGEVTASWTFAFALVFIAPVAGAVLAASTSTLIADVARSKSIVKSMFNAAQLALSLTVGVAAGNAIYPLLAVADGEQLGLRWLAAAFVASAVSFVLNAILISIVIALHQAMPVGEMLVRSLRVNLGMDGVLLALAPIFLLIGVEAPILVPLLLGTVILIFRSATLALSNRHEATHDQLTDMPNRRLFVDHMGLMLANAEKSSENVALIHVDLDGFKGINDRLGHHYGDEVLRHVADRMRAAKRPVDFIARLGGDEFIMALGAVGDRDTAARIAQRVWERLREPMEIEGVPLAVGASLGVALYPDDGRDLHTLLDRADMAMYDAKTNARGVAVYAGADVGAGPNRLELLAELQAGIDRGELELFYQPKVDIESDTITGVEALVRWRHPELGLVEPALFMPQAEQTELVTPLTDAVITMAAQQCSEWLAEGIRVGVSINASARNLHDLKFPTRVAALLEAAHLDPGWLEIEITENTVMADPVRASSVIGHLRSIGVSLAIDDFGTGYSSLATLRNLTIDRIKIDRSFVIGINENEGDVSIVRSVIDLGKALGLTVVAEGIENPAAYDVVKALGCHEFQGYLFSEPLPYGELLPLLRTSGSRVRRTTETASTT